MGQLFDAVVDFLTEDDWKFVAVPEETAAVLNFRGRAGSWQCFLNVDEERQWVSFFSLLPAAVPEDKRPEIAEFITRANYGLGIGNFEMDYEDGEVRCKTSVDVEGGELTPKMIDNLMRASLTTMDRYFPGFMAVIYGDEEPADAIAEIEGGCGDLSCDDDDCGGCEGEAFDEDGEGDEDLEEPDDGPGEAPGDLDRYGSSPN